MQGFTPSCRGREGVAPKERGKGGMLDIDQHFYNNIKQIVFGNNTAHGRDETARGVKMLIKKNISLCDGEGGAFEQSPF